MRAKIRDTEIYFDVEGAGLAIDGSRLRSQPVTFLVHGEPGADHTSYKPSFSPLNHKMQLIYFDHRGQGRSARGPKETYTLDNNVEDMESADLQLPPQTMTELNAIAEDQLRFAMRSH